MTENKTIVTSVAIKEEYLKKMDHLKDRCGLTKKYIINAALKEFIEAHESEFVEW